MDLLEVLAKNSDKEFVKRIIDRDNYPVLENDDGSISTHLMSYGEADGKYYAYPTIVMGRDWKLHRLSDEDAWKNAMQSGEVIRFDTEREADWFTKNYKQVWGGSP